MGWIGGVVFEGCSTGAEQAEETEGLLKERRWFPPLRPLTSNSDTSNSDIHSPTSHRSMASTPSLPSRPMSAQPANGILLVTYESNSPISCQLPTNSTEPPSLVVRLYEEHFTIGAEVLFNKLISFLISTHQLIQTMPRRVDDRPACTITTAL